LPCRRIRPYPHRLSDRAGRAPAFEYAEPAPAGQYEAPADASVAVERIAHYEREMARIVQKFGGTSVADLDRIANAACRVKREVDAGNEVAVVVSAMAGATNQLVEWTRQVSRLHDAREYDVVVAAGEQITAGLMALSLQTLGV